MVEQVSNKKKRNFNLISSLSKNKNKNNIFIQNFDIYSKKNIVNSKLGAYY